MITFYKHDTKTCLACYETEQALKDMVVAHTSTLLKGNDPPAIIEGQKKIISHKAIKNYIRDLEKTMQLWQKFQGDSCYIDSDGKVC